ncbi:uncharacterized protein KD926_004547 [Aspergillus affinis]|uniref:uncharacterized protein n=1 Tax=Aspergillus affinis TaxID=1070780 RepID=UPI0022FF2AF0|nr:uncharacterized protein KD926_004547 [Aspergillus affinis]KAI9043044.1 hypothetical protein KD926_004547 [Aspergillus affinis]
MPYGVTMRSCILSTLLLATAAFAMPHSPNQQRSKINTDDIPVVNLVTGLLRALNVDADVSVNPDNLLKNMSKSQVHGLAACAKQYLPEDAAASASASGKYS